MLQPAGPAGRRRVFLTLSFSGEDGCDQLVEFVLTERAAHELGEALTSGSIGIMRKIELTPDSSE
jgi:hypothetical protein